MALSKTQIDKLGERLRSGTATAADVRELDEYRRSFAAAQTDVLERLHAIGLRPSGRSAKVTRSIADKLRRESIRLSQIQDIAGCRVVVTDVPAQDEAVSAVRDLFPTAATFDRREEPSYGYRAVHLVPRIGDRSVEIQVRTELQHEWAALSEKFADSLDPRLKYGEGDATALALLKELSGLIRGFEDHERFVSGLTDGPDKRDILAAMAVDRGETLSLIRRLEQGLKHRGRMEK